MELPGSAIREALEFSVSKNILRVLQVSGVKVVYDLSREPFERIIDLKVLCQNCNVPCYEDLEDDKYYRVVVTEYTAKGGDDYTMFKKYARNEIVGPLDIEALVDYVKVQSPIKTPALLKRIKFI